ncbi:hypothetical protein STEG23_010939 [Scotinomys teguina]
MDWRGLVKWRGQGCHRGMCSKGEKPDIGETGTTVYLAEEGQESQGSGYKGDEAFIEFLLWIWIKQYSGHLVCNWTSFSKQPVSQGLTLQERSKNQTRTQKYQLATGLDSKCVFESVVKPDTSLPEVTMPSSSAGQLQDAPATGGAAEGLALPKQEAGTLATTGHLMWSANGADIWKPPLSTLTVT